MASHFAKNKFWNLGEKTLSECMRCLILSLLDNIYIRFGTKLYRQIVGIPMVTNWPLTQLIYFYTATKEISCILLTMTIKLMLSRPLIRLLGTSIGNPYFEGMVNQITVE